MQRTLVIAALALGIATPALAQQKADLPKSGSFTVHSGFKSIGETAQITDKHILVANNTWGVSFNDAGSGPLHIGPIVCKSINESIEGAGSYFGKCAWSDSDGDKIFTDSSGKFTPTSGLAGTGIITGGTGKFSGIHGKTAFQCKTLSAPTGQGACMHKFDYELAAEATGSTAPPTTSK
jgi:hypothetical protein